MDFSLASIVTELQKNPDHYNSSIEHGGTRPFSYVMDYKAIFQYVEFLVLLYFGIFLWLRCEVVFPMHMTMVWDLANGAGIPALSDAIDVWVSKRQSSLIGGDGDSSSTAGPKTRATEQMSESHCLHKQTTSSE